MYIAGRVCKHTGCTEAQRARQGPINEAHAPPPPARPPPPGAAAAAPPAASPWVGAPRGASREPYGRLGAAGAGVQEGGLALGVARGPLGCVTSAAGCDLTLCRSRNSWGKLQRRAGGGTQSWACAAWGAHGWRRRLGGAGHHRSTNDQHIARISKLKKTASRRYVFSGRIEWNGATEMLPQRRPMATSGGGSGGMPRQRHCSRTSMFEDFVNLHLIRILQTPVGHRGTGRRAAAVGQTLTWHVGRTRFRGVGPERHTCCSILSTVRWAGEAACTQKARVRYRGFAQGPPAAQQTAPGRMRRREQHGTPT